jgi:hypothetical protein
MPSFATERFLDATIVAQGDTVCIRFQTDA